MRLWLLLPLLLMASCVPAAHGANQAQLMAAATRTPRPEAIQVDTKGTAAAVELQAAIVAATSQAGAILATQAGATAKAEANMQSTQAVSVERTWQVTGWTATAGAVQATATAQARGTATAQVAPVLTITAEALQRKVDRDKQQAALDATWAPWWRRLNFFFWASLLGLALFLIIKGVNWAYAAWDYRARAALPFVDADMDTAEPAQVAAASRYYIEKDGEESTWIKVVLPLTDEQLKTLAHALYRGVPFAERHFTARSVPNFRAVQDAAIAAGLAAWRNTTEPRQGCYLTGKGERFFFGQVLGVSKSPSPSGISAISPAWTHADVRNAPLPHGGEEV